MSQERSFELMITQSLGDASGQGGPHPLDERLIQTQDQTEANPTKLAETPEVAGYQLLKELARGGMGIIYQARDLTINRNVAIKLLHERFSSDSPAARRFLEEAQITGQLQHPGIPPIYQVGRLTNGRPFLAMKLIKGETLEALVKSSAAGLKARGDARLNYLALLEAIAQAVGYAHAHGVIHRDLKPQNIMIGHFGEVQVVDWGLAKLLGELPSTSPTIESAAASTTMYNPRVDSDGSHTQAGMVLGTPAYMAPEQAAGENDKIGPRTDVFALGAVLCHMLTQHPPYAGKSNVDVRMQAVRGQMNEALARLDACEAEPEVVALCKRCLAFDPKDRPADGNAVAAQVAALRHEAELRARRAEIAQVQAETQAAEQRKRRRVIQWSAVAITAVLLAGLAASLWQMSRAMEAEGRAAANEIKALSDRDAKSAALAAANQAKQEAEERRIEAEKARIHEEQERQYAQAIADFVRNDFLGLSTVDGQTRFGKDAEDRLGKNATLQDILARAAKKLDARQDLDPRIEAELRWMIGVQYRYQGDYQRAIAFLERCVALRQQALGADHGDTLYAQNSLAVAYETAGRLPQALRLFEQVRDAQIRKLGADHPSTLNTMNNLAVTYQGLGRLPEAIQLLEQVREARTTSLGSDHPKTLNTVVNLAVAYRAAGRIPEAIRLFEQVRSARLARLGPEHPDALAALGNLAVTYRLAGRHPEAIQLLEQVCEVRRRTLEADHPDTLTALGNLAATYRAVGRLSEAIRLFEQVRDVHLKKLGLSHLETITTLNNLAGAYQDAGRLAEAIRLFEQVRDLQIRKLGEDHPSTLATLSNLAGAYQDVGRLAEAIRLFEQVRDSQIRKLGEDHPSTLTTLNNLAAAYIDTGRLAEAIRLFEQVCEVREKKLGPDHPEFLTAVGNLAQAYWSANRLPEALPLFERAGQGIARRRFQHPHAQLIIPTMIQAYDAAREFDKADAWRREWLAVVKMRAGAESPAYASLLAEQGQSLVLRGKWPEAETVLRECLALRQKQQPNAWTTFNTMSILGAALAAQKKYAEAEPFLLKGYQGLKERQKFIPPQGWSRIPETCERLIALYTALNRPDDVKQWLAEQAKNSLRWTSW
jgi:serine/threonine protein kinase